MTTYEKLESTFQLRLKMNNFEIIVDTPILDGKSTLELVIISVRKLTGLCVVKPAIFQLGAPWPPVPPPPPPQSPRPR